MRNAHDPDTAQALIEIGQALGLACPVCPHRVIFDLRKIASDPRPVWRLPFRCQCGESKVFKYILSDEQDIKDFEARHHPRGTNGHHTTWSR